MTEGAIGDCCWPAISATIKICVSLARFNLYNNTFANKLRQQTQKNLIPFSPYYNGPATPFRKGQPLASSRPFYICLTRFFSVPNAIS
jgi:hypothetical protein